MIMLDLCCTFAILYIIVCVLNAICKWRESEETSKLKKTVNFIKDVVLYPIQLLVKVFKKKETQEVVKTGKSKKKGKK